MLKAKILLTQIQEILRDNPDLNIMFDDGIAPKNVSCAILSKITKRNEEVSGECEGRVGEDILLICGD